MRARAGHDGTAKMAVNSSTYGTPMSLYFLKTLLVLSNLQIERATSKMQRHNQVKLSPLALQRPRYCVTLIRRRNNNVEGELAAASMPASASQTSYSERLKNLA